MATNAKNLAELLNTDTTVKVGDVENGSINADKLAATLDLSSKTVTLANGAVDTGQIADNAITALKLNITGDGTSGQFLKTDGDGSFDYINAPTVKTPTQQIFTADGTWTKPTDCTKVKVTVVGGGGGSGAVKGKGHSSMAPPKRSTSISGAGGAGGTSIKLIDVTSISSETVTVGAGGSAGTIAGTTSNPGDGSNGSTSSFGSHCSATGGAGGDSAGKSSGGSQKLLHCGQPGDGGTGSGGDLNFKGGRGKTNNSHGMTYAAVASWDTSNNNTSDEWNPGIVSGMMGGTSSLGSDNVLGTAAITISGTTINWDDATIAPGTATANTGNGANSAFAQGATDGQIQNGGAGAAGIVIVEEYYS